MIKKLLVANRGEIAVRVIRAAREMGIRTVAVASEADAGSAHARMADQCVLIGPAEAVGSYLDMGAILRAAQATAADAVHPGYGFLSERPEFAEACVAAGLKFVGPSAAAMRRLGSKSEAKRLAVEEGVPIVPGCYAEGAGLVELRESAASIGYPVMLKASAGGGGRGMRVVRKAGDFEAEWRMATEEATQAFGDGAMMVERLVERPRHIEVQVLADDHGQIAALFERECSIQRRHQKLIEECPTPLWAKGDGPPGWSQLRDAAVRLVRAAGYVGAGTVEFMVDPEAGEFYFLEVNARLQVEHPVTEAATGIDLVQQQLRIASGERLELASELMSGDRRALQGCTIEARVVAENPAAGFRPSIGTILGWAEPRMPGVRVDSGFGGGAVVSRHYDSLLAKVIAHAPTRSEAIRRLRLALEDFHILGVDTNIAFLLDVLADPEFEEGRLDTGFLGRRFHEWHPGEVPTELGAVVGMATHRAGATEPTVAGAWTVPDRFRNSRQY